MQKQDNVQKAVDNLNKLLTHVNVKMSNDPSTRNTQNQSNLKPVTKIDADYDKIIKKFHESVKEGPRYICCSCTQTWFKHSVHPIQNLPDNATKQKCVLDLKSHDGKTWICSTCREAIKQDRVPRYSTANGLKFPEKPEELKLCPLEERLVAPRIPFMQIHELPAGKQYSIRGNVVNVPIDINPIVQTLPRYAGKMETVPVKFKRRINHKSSVYTQNINPEKVMNAVYYLKNTSEFYSDISVDSQWLENFTENNFHANNSENDISSRVDADKSHDAVESDDYVTRNDQVTRNETNNEDADIDFDNQIGPSGDTLLDEFEVDPNSYVTFAPGEGQTPIGLFKDENAEILSFPTIYCGQKRISNEERAVKLSYADICKWELRAMDRRCAMSIPNLFFKTKALQVKQIADKVSLVMKRAQETHRNYTAGEILKKTAEIINLDEGYRIFKDLRGSPSYLEKRKKDLFAMLRQLGTPHIFMSLSAAETHWPELLTTLGQLVDNKTYTVDEIKNMTSEQKFRLVQSDPVTCCRYFEHRYTTFFRKILQDKSNPLGVVKHYFVRVEIQGRGSPHVHIILWLEDGKLYQIDDIEEVIAFIDRTCSCSSNVKEEHKPYLKMQKHKHTRTCRKGKEKDCRFNFPIPPMKKTCILKPLEVDEDPNKYKEMFQYIKCFLNTISHDTDIDISYTQFLEILNVSEEDYIKAVRSSIKKDKIFLARQVNEIWINSYMKNMLHCWQANHDVQAIIDCYQVAQYIVAYLSKSEKGMSALMRKAVEEAESENCDLKQKVRHIGNKFLNGVEISAQLAAYLTLQLPITKASKEVTFVNTSELKKRTRVLKDKKALEELAEKSCDVFVPGVIQKYESRPKVYENMCLADFVSKVSIKYPKNLEKDVHDQETNEDEVDDGNSNENNFISENIPCYTFSNGTMYLPRKNAKVIRFVNYHKDTDYENYCRERLMLYYPWRNEQKDLVRNDTSASLFEDVKESIFDKMQEYESCKEILDTIEEDVDVFDETENENEESENEGTPKDFGFFDPERPENQSKYDINEDMGLPHNAQVEFSEVIGDRCTEQEYYEMIRNLNLKQREIFNHVLHWIRTNKEPLRMMLSGGAGTGKTMVTKCLYQALVKHLCSTEGENPDDIRVLMCAPTGKASYILGRSSMTIHSAFKINPNKSLRSQDVLSHATINTLRHKLRNLEVLVLDEVSMVGNQLFRLINLRLQQIKENKFTFGRIHVICTGDLFQLSPVFDGWIFKNLKHDYGPLATNLWKDDMFMLFELTQIMRQKDDAAYAEIMNRLREGNHTEHDLQTITSRKVVENQKDSKICHLFVTNKKVDQFNDDIINKPENPYANKPIPCKDCVLGNLKNPQGLLKSLANKNVSQTANLMYRLPIALDERYDITYNVNTEDGLTNGMSCFLKHITCDNDTPKILWVLFDETSAGQVQRKKYARFYTSEISRTWTPIFAIKLTFYTSRKSIPVMRSQFPLRPSMAKTVHKSQGSTENKLCIDLESRRSIPHIHYVALSRVTNLDNIVIENLNEDMICIDKDVEIEMKRLRNTRCLQLCFMPPYFFRDDSLKVAFLNIRSLRKHFLDMTNDSSFYSVDILLFCETKLREEEIPKFQIPGFSTHFICENAAEGMPHKGLIAYVKDELQINNVNTYRIDGNEFLLLEVLHRNFEYQVVVLYRSCHGSINDFRRNIEFIGTDINPNKKILIIGDFNHDISKDSSLKHFLKQNIYVNHIWTSETYQTTSGSCLTTIDHILTNETNYITSVIECPYSDHKILAISLGFSETIPISDENRPVLKSLKQVAHHNDKLEIESDMKIDLVSDSQSDYDPFIDIDLFSDPD